MAHVLRREPDDMKGTFPGERGYGSFSSDIPLRRDRYNMIRALLPLRQWPCLRWAAHDMNCIHPLLLADVCSPETALSPLSHADCDTPGMLPFPHCIDYGLPGIALPDDYGN